MEIKSLEVDGPWKLSSRFKSRFIEAKKSTKIELKFKQAETTECRIHIKLEVDELEFGPSSWQSPPMSTSKLCEV